MQILLYYSEIYQFHLITRLIATSLVFVVHRKEEIPGLINKVPIKYNGDTNSAWQAEQKPTDKVKSQIILFSVLASDKRKVELCSVQISVKITD